jgi:N,N'-diacetylchitobiose transport system permease protein
VVGRIVTAVLTIALCLFALFPFYWMVASAFDKYVGTTGALWPSQVTLAHFAYVMTEGKFGLYLRNSLLVALVVVVASSFIALLASVAVARFRFAGRRAILLLVLVIQMVPMEALVIPLFLQAKQLDLLGKLTGLMVVYTALALPFGVWMLRGFVAAVPIDLEEAAYLDGATWWKMFFHVLFPLVVPGLVATSVFSFITAWNEFVFAMTMLGPQIDKYTVSIGLRAFFGLHANDWGAIMAGSTIITIPVMIFFIAVQKRLAGGLTSGAVKG